MTLVRWSPVAQLASMEIERLNRMFDQVWGGDASRGTWVPPVDIYEDESHSVVLRAELPGLTREDIHVTVENDYLTLRGERKAQHEVRRDRYHHLERAYGQFSRSFTVPATLDTSKIAASYRDGVLTVTIPSREDAKPKQIPVETR